MNCADAKLKLEPCVSGTLPPEERIELQEHLATCEGCRLELELTRAVMGSAPFESPDEPQAPAVEPPPVPSMSEPPPQHQESRPQTPLFDEMSFGDLAPASAATAGVPPPHAEGAPAAGGPDPFENFTAKPEAPAETAATTWDFEPVEVPRDASPPQGSLSFANEALTRKKEGEQKRKATLVRLALWGGGIGCGMVLLGISVWIALAFRQDRPAEVPPSGQNPPVAPTGQNPPVAPTGSATVAPPDATPTSNPPGSAVAPVSGTTDTSPPQASSSSAPTPAASSSSAPTPPATDAQTPTILEATPGVAPSPGPPPPAKSKSKPKGAGKPVAASTTRKGSAGDEGEFPWRPVDDPPVTRNVTRRETAQQPGNSTTTPPAPDAGAPPAGATSPAPTSPGPGSETAGGAAPANPSQPTGAPTTETPAQTPPNQEPQAQDAAPTKPIDRLHLATDTAAKNQDLATLRKLKSTWKSLITSTAGPDRTRAKREFADCLWSIQEMTGRNSDRREALTAYRDYVLYAPAGGADPRTISRMRYLEDILTDK